MKTRIATAFLLLHLTAGLCGAQRLLPLMVLSKIREGTGFAPSEHLSYLWSEPMIFGILLHP